MLLIHSNDSGGCPPFTPLPRCAVDGWGLSASPLPVIHNDLLGLGDVQGEMFVLASLFQGTSSLLAHNLIAWEIMLANADYCSK